MARPRTRAWDAGERGLACQPGREAEFRDGIARALDYAGGPGLPAPARHGRAGACGPDP
jgi:hydroxypyruvate isomerase